MLPSAAWASTHHRRGFSITQILFPTLLVFPMLLVGFALHVSLQAGSCCGLGAVADRGPSQTENRRSAKNTVMLAAQVDNPQFSIGSSGTFRASIYSLLMRRHLVRSKE